MSSTPVRTLILEDSESDAAMTVRLLKRAGYEVTWERIDSEAEFHAALSDRPWDIVISDYQMPQFDARRALRALRNTGMDLPLIVMSGAFGEEIAVDLMRLGAKDFVTKGNLGRLAPAVTRELTDAKDRRAQRLAADALRASDERFRRILEASPVPYAINDADANITQVNTAFVQTFGYTLTDIPTLLAWWPKAYPDAAYREWVKQTWQTRLEASQRNGLPFEPFEAVICCKNGSRRIVLINAAPLSGSLAQTHLVILTDITEHRRLERQVLEAVTGEQQRLAMDLHDGLGQELTGLAMLVSGIARGGTNANPVLAGELQQAAAIARRCVSTARAVARGLSPLSVHQGNLTLALQELVSSTMEVFGVEVTFEVQGPLKTTRLSEEQATGLLGIGSEAAYHLYRITQEAISNSIKHGRATRIDIHLEIGIGNLLLRIIDNGFGFDTDKKNSGSGLDIMRYRAQAIGGHLAVQARSCGGVEVKCVYNFTHFESKPAVDSRIGCR